MLSSRFVGDIMIRQLSDLDLATAAMDPLSRTYASSFGDCGFLEEWDRDMIIAGTLVTHSIRRRYLGRFWPAR